ncbi:long-chain-fatty-acid--CoA ligase 1-like isoform X2 [Lineus longissimus]|uniref:long-chain-fatty-acid--CoA ligase 1-like isoform X2 n=1 Tax=Lineus longissimus TaxID=88925 RepID=UPI002B4ED36C
MNTHVDRLIQSMSDFVHYLGGHLGAVAVGAITTATAAYLISRPKKFRPLVDLNNQSKEVPGLHLARMSTMCTDGELKERAYDDVGTIYQAFRRGARVSNNGECLGWREGGTGPYRWISYNDVLSKSANVGAGLLEKGLVPNHNTFVGIYSQNRVEYVVTELACYSYSMAIVPLYDTLGPDACTYIINQADMSLVVCDNVTKVNALLDRIEATPILKTIVVIETPDQELRKRAESLGIEIVSFSDLEELGKKHPKEIMPSQPDDLCTICYTSGTTGSPKGAMITHRNVIAGVSGCHLTLAPLGVGTEDIIISYLPLAHMYERINHVYTYMNGAKVGFFSGDVKKLLDDIRELRPTMFPTVPRLLNRLYDQVMGQVSSSLLKKILFTVAINRKTSELSSGILRNNSIWDQIVFKKVQMVLGGRLKFICTGSAPISDKVLAFVRCAVGCPVLEGYGQTESAAVSTLSVISHNEPGHVGPPLPCTMIKLKDVPDMGYKAEDNKGEICFKGPSVFNGYLKDPEKTAETLDEDGWLHSGDIGMWLPNGTLKIIDRKKNIFKLSQGEYIAPEKIEQIYVRSMPVAQVFVHGDSLQSFLVGIVIPDPDHLMKWAKNTLGLEGGYKQLCENEEVQKAILEDMTSIGKKAGLKSFEQVKNIHVHPELFSVENGLMTPTFKSKRNEILKYFKQQLENLYTVAAL